MQFTSQNTEDISKYFDGTFVKFRETGDRLFIINSIHKSVVYAEDARGDQIEIKLWPDQPFEMQTYSPHKAYFQTKNGACLLARRPMRQFRRGICNDNTSITLLTPDGKSKNCSITFELLQQYVDKPQYTSPDNLAQATTSVCLSSRIAYAPVTKTLYVDSLEIGKLVEDHLIRLRHRDLFRNEVFNVFKAGKKEYYFVY